MEVSPKDYFKVDLQEQLPEAEIKRRQATKRKLESHFEQWQRDEQHLWSAIPQPTTLSFLGLDWSTILPIVKRYLNPHGASFELLSQLQLCPIRSSTINSYLNRHKTPPENWLYKQYQQYAIRILDFGEKEMRYYIPLIDITTESENGNPDLVSRMVPSPTKQDGQSTCRLIIFPQTRYSFIADETFQELYPLPEEQVERMAHKLLHRFQGNNGYYNVLPTTFFDSFTHPSHTGHSVRYFAAMYPVIELEFVSDYENRKKTELFITSLQEQKRRNLPTISQARYSRKFDLKEESILQAEVRKEDTCPERIQSARALFEYACGDHDTLALDARQTSLLEGSESETRDGKHLLVVDPLWILIFPGSETICAFRNVNMDDPFKEIWKESPSNGAKDVGEVLIELLNGADRCMGSYEPTYRRRLSSLQYKIHSTDDHHLVKLLSDFVAELTIVLDPLAAQISALKYWQRCQWINKSKFTEGLFEEAIKSREKHLDSLKRLQERARELQALLFQLSNTKAAYLQSQVAAEMARETRKQVELATRMETQSKSILIFTIVTVIFLPLSFFTSYFGMNTIDIRDMPKGQGFFWLVSGPISIVIIVIAFLIAFEGYRNFGLMNRRKKKEKSHLLTEMELGLSKRSKCQAT